MSGLGGVMCDSREETRYNVGITGFIRAEFKAGQVGVFDVPIVVEIANISKKGLRFHTDTPDGIQIGNKYHMSWELGQIMVAVVAEVKSLLPETGGFGCVVLATL